MAMAMMLSVMVVGAGAATALDDYPDVDQVTEKYLEAIDLLTAINVLQGDDTGAFRPGDSLNRAEAAKLVAYTCLGRDDAENLPKGATPFTDLTGYEWASGYIGYCSSVGIINGRSETVFDPGSNVTGYEMAKMLLCCLGYGKMNEYVGNNWSMNTIRDGISINLFDRLDSTVSADPINREEAAQLVYNTLISDLVVYSSLYGTYLNHRLDAGSNAQSGSSTLLGDIATNIFKVQKAHDTDGYGFDYHYWRHIDSVDAITNNYDCDMEIGTVTDSQITAGAFYKEFTWNTVSNGDAVEVFVNGSRITDVIVEGKGAENAFSDSDSYIVNTADKVDDGVVFLGGGSTTHLDLGDILKNMSGKPFVNWNGYTAVIVDEDTTTTNRCEGDGDADKIVIYQEYLAEVTKVTEATTYRDRFVTANVYDFSGEIRNVEIETEDFEVGDMILVVPSEFNAAAGGTDDGFADPLSVKLAEVVTGTVDKYYPLTSNTTPSVVVNTGDGEEKLVYNGVFTNKDINVKTTYQVDGVALGYEYASAGYKLDSATYDFYLDTLGNVIGVEEVEGSIGDLIYITKVGEDAPKRDNYVEGINNAGEKVKAYLSEDSDLYDKTSMVLDNPAHPNNNDGLADADEGVGYIYSYSMDGDEIVLERLDGRYTSIGKATIKDSGLQDGYTSVRFTNGFYNNQDGNMIQTGTVYATENTVILFVDADGDLELRTVGYNEIPDLVPGFNYESAIATHSVGNQTKAEMVVLIGEPDGTYENHMYIVAQVGFQKGDVQEYLVILEGKLTTINSKDKDLIAGDVYSYSYDEDENVYDMEQFKDLSGTEQSTYIYEMNTANPTLGMVTEDNAAGTVITFDDAVSVVPDKEHVVMQKGKAAEVEYALDSEYEISFVGDRNNDGQAPEEEDILESATVQGGDKVTYVLDDGLDGDIVAIYINAYDMAYISSINYNITNTTDHTLYDATTGITTNGSSSAAFNIFSKGDITVGDLINESTGKLLNLTETDPSKVAITVYSTHAAADAGGTGLGSSTALIDEVIYYVRVTNNNGTPGNTADDTYNVFEFTLNPADGVVTLASATASEINNALKTNKSVTITGTITDFNEDIIVGDGQTLTFGNNITIPAGKKLTVNGTLNAEDITIAPADPGPPAVAAGELTINGTATVKDIVNNGVLNAPGTLNAESVTGSSGRTTLATANVASVALTGTGSLTVTEKLTSAGAVSAPTLAVAQAATVRAAAVSATTSASVAANATVTATTGDVSLAAATIAGTVQAPAGDVALTGAATIDGGTVTAADAVTMVDATITGGTVTAGTGNVTITGDVTADADSALESESGSVDASGGSLEVEEGTDIDETVTGVTTTGTVTISGTGYAINAPATGDYNVTLTGTASNIDATVSSAIAGVLEETGVPVNADGTVKIGGEDGYVHATDWSELETKQHALSFPARTLVTAPGDHDISKNDDGKANPDNTTDLAGSIKGNCVNDYFDVYGDQITTIELNIPVPADKAATVAMKQTNPTLAKLWISENENGVKTYASGSLSTEAADGIITLNIFVMKGDTITVTVDYNNDSTADATYTIDAAGVTVS